MGWISEVGKQNKIRYDKHNSTIKKYSKDRGCFLDLQKEVMLTCKDIKKGKILNLSLCTNDKNDTD